MLDPDDLKHTIFKVPSRLVRELCALEKKMPAQYEVQ